ncbi:MAG: GTP-binding protein [Promethearchaeota archaeon]
MVTIADGRFSLPENLLYTKNQHVFIDRANKLIGLDQIGFAYLTKPTELALIAESSGAVKIGEPFAVITTSKGITTLNSPCTGTIKSVNPQALQKMETDTYTEGYILELETIEEVEEGLITGAAVEPWATHEVRSLLKNEYTFKIIEIGDSATGKTAIKVRFTDSYFKLDLKTTLGVDFGSKEIVGAYTPADTMFSGTYRFKAKINLWDAAGQAHYDKIRGIYYRDAKGALLCYDINNPVSFQNLDKWLLELEENVGRIPTILVGNKSDLERKVSQEDALNYSKAKGLVGFIEVSAKTGEKVDEALQQLAVSIYKIEENLE